MTPDYYSLLGVREDATHREIREAYRKRAMVSHPDKGGSQARMQELNQAWAVLGDLQARRAYDQERNLDRRSGTATATVLRRPAPPRRKSPPRRTLVKVLAFHFGRLVGWAIRPRR